MARARWPDLPARLAGGVPRGDARDHNGQSPGAEHARQEGECPHETHERVSGVERTPRLTREHKKIASGEAGGGEHHRASNRRVSVSVRDHADEHIESQPQQWRQQDGDGWIGVMQQLGPEPTG